MSSSRKEIILPQKMHGMLPVVEELKTRDEVNQKIKEVNFGSK